MITVCIGCSLVVDRVRWSYLGISQNIPIAFFTWCVDISFSQTEENYSSNYICHEQYFNVSFSTSLFIPCCTSSICCRKKRRKIVAVIYINTNRVQCPFRFETGISVEYEISIKKQTKTRNRHDLLRLHCILLFSLVLQYSKMLSIQFSPKCQIR